MEKETVPMESSTLVSPSVSTTVGSGENRTSKDEEKNKRDEEKKRTEKRLEEWVKSLSFSDVEFNEELGTVKSIAGRAVSEIKAKTLLMFVRSIGLKVPNGATSKDH